MNLQVVVLAIFRNVLLRVVTTSVDRMFAARMTSVTTAVQMFDVKRTTRKRVFP